MPGKASLWKQPIPEKVDGQLLRGAEGTLEGQEVDYFKRHDVLYRVLKRSTFETDYCMVR